MFEVGDYLVYRRDVCKVIEIKKNFFKDKDGYVLKPVNDDSLKIKIPVNNTHIRKLLSKEEIESLINRISEIPVIEGFDKLIENEYRNLLKSENHEDLIKVIKTTYARNQERLDNNKKIGEKDDNYFKLAETYLYSEIAIVLNMGYEQAKQYVIDKVQASHV